MNRGPNLTREKSKVQRQRLNAQITKRHTVLLGKCTAALNAARSDSDQLSRPAVVELAIEALADKLGIETAGGDK